MSHDLLVQMAYCFKTPSIGPAPGIDRTHDLLLCRQALYRLN